MKYIIRVPSDDFHLLKRIQRAASHDQESTIFNQLHNSPPSSLPDSIFIAVPSPKNPVSYEWEMKNSSDTNQGKEDGAGGGRGGEDEEAESKKYYDEEEEEEEEEEERARCEWDFNLSITISSSANSSTSDAIGVLEFDQTSKFLATGGIARKIRIYNADKSLQNDGKTLSAASLDHASACEFYICTPAKLSSLKWKPGSGSRVVGSGDYDGVVMEYDLERRVPVFERDEHGGRKVWSMDYSRWDPAVGASGSDDGSMQMWDPRCDEAGTRVRPNPASSSPVCSVEFDPSGRPYIVAGCADRRVYTYDVRMVAEPVFVFDRHEKPVTYAKYLDERTIISSSIDGSMMMWRAGNSEPVRVYKGHVNSRRFVGLSVWRGGGLLSCGSEDNRVFVYDKRWGEPIWARGLEPVARSRGECGFVSGVCWRETGEDRCALVAGGSDGVLQVFEGERKTISCS